MSSYRKYLILWKKFFSSVRKVFILHKIFSLYRENIFQRVEKNFDHVEIVFLSRGKIFSFRKKLHRVEKYFDLFDQIFYNVIYKKIYHVNLEQYFHCIENLSSCT